jgi:hypothetical protein
VIIGRLWAKCHKGRSVLADGYRYEEKVITLYLTGIPPSEEFTKGQAVEIQGTLSLTGGLFLRKC